MTLVPGSAIVYLPGSSQGRAFKIPPLHLITQQGHETNYADLFDSLMNNKVLVLWDLVLNSIITNCVIKSQGVYRFVYR